MMEGIVKRDFKYIFEKKQENLLVRKCIKKKIKVKFTSEKNNKISLSFFSSELDKINEVLAENKIVPFKEIVSDKMKLKRNYYSYIGVFLGLISILLIGYFFSGRVLDVKIYGTEKISVLDIENFLDTYNLLDGDKRGIETDEIEKEILSNFEDVSLVSVAVKGNNVLINIKEKIQDNFFENEKRDIISDAFGIVDSIVVTRGTALVSVGDSVAIGSVLISGSDGKNEFIAEGKIVLREYLVSSAEMLYNESVLVRTGAYSETHSFKLFGIEVVLGDEENFINEEVVIDEKNNLLNIRVIRKYELKEEVKINTLENDGEIYRKKAEEDVKEKLTANNKILDQYNFTSENQYGIIFSSVIIVEKIIE